MRRHDLCNDGLRGEIERGQRLVEQPDRAKERNEPGERGAPLLSGREIGGGQIGDGAEAETRKRGFDLCRAGPRLLVASKAARKERFSKAERLGFRASAWPT